MRKLEQEVQFVKEEEEVERGWLSCHAGVSVHSEGLGGKHIQRIAPKKGASFTLCGKVKGGERGGVSTPPFN